MSPQELLVELQALQLEAMYDREQEGSCATRKKSLGSMTEQFLIDQVRRVKLHMSCMGMNPWDGVFGSFG